jgi:hypothetical protein
LCGKLEVEGRPAVYRPFGPDSTPVTVNDPLHGRETDPGPRKLVHRVESLKGSEELVREGHVESRSVVAHEKNFGSILVGLTELDAN